MSVSANACPRNQIKALKDNRFHGLSHVPILAGKSARGSVVKAPGSNLSRSPEIIDSGDRPRAAGGDAARPVAIAIPCSLHSFPSVGLPEIARYRVSVVEGGPIRRGQRRALGRYGTGKGILYPLRMMSGGVETEGADKIIEVVDDSLIEAVELGSLLMVEAGRAARVLQAAIAGRAVNPRCRHHGEAALRPSGSGGGRLQPDEAGPAVACLPQPGSF
jgi:hypothetical protein